MNYILCCLCFFCSITYSLSATANKTHIKHPKDTPTKTAKPHQKARQRIARWHALITNSRDLPERKKLIIVNDFFNKVHYLPDDASTHRADYWMTPYELLESNAGDCEDFSIAKYFTLKAMGVDEKKLRITYVKALRYQRAHMVLSYYKTPSSDPLILDNLIDEIRPASLRVDLLPVYSFNGDGLWLAKRRGANERVGTPKQLGRWQGVLKRMRVSEELERQDEGFIEEP